MASADLKKRLLDLLEGTKAATGYYGLGDLYVDTDSISEDIWTAPTYTDAERTGIVEKLAAMQVKVLGEYPRSDSQLPCIVIQRLSDAERPEHLGDYLGVADTSDADDYQEHHQYGSDFNERLQLTIMTGGKASANLRDLLYLAVREIVVRGRLYLVAAGVTAVQWADGRDGEMFQRDKAPHIAHQATASIRYINHMTWTEKSTRVTKFRGYSEEYGGRVKADEYETE